MIDLNNLIDLLPYYYKQNDTYKEDGRGILQRFLEICGSYFKENPIENIDNTLENLRIDSCPDTFLRHFWEFLGSLPFAYGREIDEEKFKAYFDGTWDGKDKWEKVPNPTNPLNPASSSELPVRTILSQAVSLFKIRGTKKFYELLFRLYNIDVTISYEDPVPTINYPRLDQSHTSWDHQTFDREVAVETFTLATFTVTMNSISDIATAKDTIEAFINRFVPFYIKPVVLYKVGATIVDPGQPTIKAFWVDNQNQLIRGIPFSTPTSTEYANLQEELQIKVEIKFDYAQPNAPELLMGVSSTVNLPDHWVKPGIKPSNISNDKKTFEFLVPISHGSRVYYFAIEGYNPTIHHSAYLYAREIYVYKTLVFKPEVFPEGGKDVLATGEEKKTYKFLAYNAFRILASNLSGNSFTVSDRVETQYLEVFCSNTLNTTKTKIGNSYQFELTRKGTYYFYPKGADSTRYSLELDIEVNTLPWDIKPKDELVVYNLHWITGVHDTTENTYDGLFIKSQSPDGTVTLVPWENGTKVYILPPDSNCEKIEVRISKGKNVITQVTDKESLDGVEYFVYNLPMNGNKARYDTFYFAMPGNTENMATLKISYQTSSASTFQEIVQSFISSPNVMNQDSVTNPTLELLLKVTSSDVSKILDRYKDKQIPVILDNGLSTLNLRYTSVQSEGSNYKVLKYTGTVSDFTSKAATMANGTTIITAIATLDNSSPTTQIVYSKVAPIALCIKPAQEQIDQWTVVGESNDLGAYTEATFMANSTNRKAKFKLFYKDENTSVNVTSSPNIGTFSTGDGYHEVEVPTDGKDVTLSYGGDSVKLHLSDIKEVVTLICEPTTTTYKDGTPVTIRIRATNTKGNFVKISDGKFTHDIPANGYKDLSYSETGTITFATVDQYYASAADATKSIISCSCTIYKNVELTLIPSPISDTIELTWGAIDNEAKQIQIKLGESGSYSIV